MTARLALALCAITVSAAHGATLTPSNDDGVLVNAVVALVNGDAVTKLEVDSHVAEFLRANPEATREQLRKIWEQAREAVIDHRLLIQEARRRSVQVPPEIVNERIERYKKAGLKVEGRRDLIRERLMVEGLLRQLVTARSIAPREVTDYYERHREDFLLPERRHVFLIAVRGKPGDSTDAVKEQAQKLHERLRKGEDFVAMAKAESQGAYAEKGGDHGWLKKGALVGKLDEVVFALKPGEVSVPAATRDGYVLVKVAAVQPANQQPLAKARAAILDRLQAEYRFKRRRQLIEGLRSTASVIRLDAFPKAK